jgi:hypothetical protein
MSQRSSHTHCQVAQADTQAQTWQRVCLPLADKIELKKISSPSENKKYAIAQTNTTKTEKHSIDNGLQTRTTEHQLPTAVWCNGGCSASYDSFAVGSSAVLRLNFCAKNPTLRQAANRWRSCPLDKLDT